ncbi:MAG: repressor LexA [Verrucomicrobia bacterium]|nr:repressor LexA [Verrucomicrobiota bacterium]
MSEALTTRQQEVLDFIQAYQQEHGVAPVLREIQKHFGFASPFAVQRHVDALTKKGALHRLAGKARGLVHSGHHPGHTPLLRIPLFGVIPAGLPTANEQEADSHISVDAATLGLRADAQLVALRVRGDSMIGANIVENDLVFLTPNPPSSVSSSNAARPFSAPKIRATPTSCRSPNLRSRA